ncbi:DUF2637 domain-containing protein [Streptomyces sp. NPDC046275]|uniref:DUF2637 domain-containing protein n=1 Tax=Streptomyces sp. NPDC046275 TaxID=3157201 RepID=UPI0033C72C51
MIHGRAQRILIGLVVAGAVVIAGIGFAGSYAAVRELAVDKGFGTFSYFFPIGIDAGICVLLALDLLLTWIRIPFPLLRQTAWVLTAATIAFNGAAAWPDPLGVGMHAVIPVLFVVAVEAARHAVGRIADITADKHMEGVRLTRWLLSPIPTFRLWRRMKLWELRSYEQVIKLEQHRLVYQAQLKSKYGRAWRRKAPVEALMPLRLAKYGVPLAESAPEVLVEAGLELVTVTVERVETEDRAETPHVASGMAPAGLLQGGPGERTDDLSPALTAVVTDSEARGAVTGDRSHETAGDRSPESVMTDDWETEVPVAEVTDQGQHEGAAPAGAPAVPHPFFSRPQPAAPPTAADMVEPLVPQDAEGREPEPVLQELAADLTDGAEVSQPAATGHPVTPQNVIGQPRGPEPVVTDTGEATARILEQQPQGEAGTDPVQQQVELVATWLAEAEESGTRLSGAEVARRLGVSPKTGQRRVIAAAEHLAEIRQQSGRSHLRPVRG